MCRLLGKPYARAAAPKPIGIVRVAFSCLGTKACALVLHVRKLHFGNAAMPLVLRECTSLRLFLANGRNYRFSRIADLRGMPIPQDVSACPGETSLPPTVHSRRHVKECYRPWSSKS